MSQLRSIVERIERLEEEIKALNDDKRDVYAEAKGNGFDVKALKSVIAYRRKDPTERDEHDAIVETYLAELQRGTPRATRVHAHEKPSDGEGAGPSTLAAVLRPTPSESPRGEPSPPPFLNPDIDIGIPPFLDRRARA